MGGLLEAEMGGGKAQSPRLLDMCVDAWSDTARRSGGMLQAGASSPRIALILLRLEEFQNEASEEDADGRNRPYDTTR